MSNRKVSTDALETLGTIIDETQKRDAIHLAVEPVEAAVRLYPGQAIDVKGGRAVVPADGKGLGIVDPFLSGPVQPGQRFWFVMYPRMVTSLRHVWSHPAFSDEVSTASPDGDSVMVIRNMADGAGITYQEMLDAAADYVQSGAYMSGGSEYEGLYCDDDFWDAYEKVTGTRVRDEKRGGVFSCAC
jgi:hypothetical protein